MSNSPIVRDALDNGLRILTEPMNQVRSISIGVWLTRGSRHETAERGGMAHFVEHMLFKGTGTRSAEDIAQTVFQRILKYRHTYRDDGSFTAWMYHLARRCAADHFRKSNAAPYATDPVNLHDHADDRPHAGADAEKRDDHALIHTALSHLDHSDREVLLLSRFQELSFAEIAGILECSVGAAKVRAHRALQQLRTVYLRLQKEPLT